MYLYNFNNIIIKQSAIKKAWNIVPVFQPGVIFPTNSSVVPQIKAIHPCVNDSPLSSRTDDYWFAEPRR